MKTILLVTIALFFPLLSLALPNNEVKDVTIYISENGKVKTKTFHYADFKPTVKFKAKSPHKLLNPESKIQEWAGVTVRSLLESMGRKNPNDTEEAIVIGTDGYFAQMIVKDFFSPDPIIATECDGKPVAADKGGPQIMFPNLDPKMKKELDFDGWGVWYVSAIMVGKFKPQLDLEINGAKPKVISFDPMSPKSETQGPLLMYYPPGNFRTPLSGKKVEVQTQDLLTVLKSEGVAEKKNLKVHTYYNGVPTNIKDSGEGFNLIYGWDKAAIPSKVGGPIHLCPKGKWANCIFYVRSIEVE